METYKVTVCRFGHANVQADSEEHAKTIVSGFAPEQICWGNEKLGSSHFLVVYAERKKTG